MNKWNIGVKYEFNIKLNVENKICIDNIGLFVNGVNILYDILVLLIVGVFYEIFFVFCVLVGYYYFFDINVCMVDVKDFVIGQIMGKQYFIKQGINEYLGGIEWDVCKWVQVSVGM